MKELFHLGRSPGTKCITFAIFFLDINLNEKIDNYFQILFFLKDTGKQFENIISS